MYKIFFHILILVSLTISSVFSQNKKIDSLLKAVPLEKTDTSRAKTYLKISIAYLTKGVADSGSLFGHKCRSLSEKVNFLKGLAASNNFIGQANIYMGFPDSAIFHFKEAKKYYEQMKDTSRISGMLNNLALVYQDQGNIPKALDYFFQALKIKEQIRDSNGIANACHNIGMTFSEAKDTASCVKYYLRALEIRRKMNDRSGVGASLVAMGQLYKSTGKASLAFEYFRESLKIAEELEEEESIAIASYNLGSICYDNKKYREATELFTKSLEISRKNKNLKGIAVCLQSIGEVRSTENDTKGAILALEEAYNISNEMDATDLIGSTSEKLSAAYEKVGDFKRALSFLRIADVVKDSLFNEENVRKLTSENLKYEHEKEKLIAQKELEQKEALAKEETFRKNLIITVSIVFLILAFIFSYTLYKRLQENRRQKLIIEEQQKEMIDSINYAKRIQYALLAHKDLLKNNLPDHFVLFKPKDIVSGDFYWATLKNDFFYLAVCDCTGHGVPGAFMSLLNINFLNEAINEKNISSPGEILDHVREQLIKKLDGGRDGMDAVLMRIPLNRKENFIIDYAAANNAPLLIRNSQVLDLPKDSMPIGLGEKTQAFTSRTIEIKSGDNLYLYTDGFADQFGGPKGKKFKYKQLDETLLLNSGKSSNDQKQNLETLFNNWKGKLEQVDDVCVVGISF